MDNRRCGNCGAAIINETSEFCPACEKAYAEYEEMAMAQWIAQEENRIAEQKEMEEDCYGKR